MLHCYLCFITNCLNVKIVGESRNGYTNTPIGHNHFQSLFNYGVKKTNNIKNAFKKGTNAKGKVLWGHHYLLGGFRKSIITLYGAAGLSTSQIQTYSTHTSAAMVDHYVQQHHLDKQRKENDKRICDYIDRIDPDHEEIASDAPISERYPIIDGEMAFGLDESFFEDESSCSSSLVTYSRMIYLFMFIYKLFNIYIYI